MKIGPHTSLQRPATVSLTIISALSPQTALCLYLRNGTSIFLNSTQPNPEHHAFMGWTIKMVVRANRRSPISGMPTCCHRRHRWCSTLGAEIGAASGLVYRCTHAVCHMKRWKKGAITYLELFKAFFRS